MKKVSLSYSMTIIFFMICLGMLSGCRALTVLSGNNEYSEKPNEPVVAVSILIGAHNNSRALNLNSPLVENSVLKAVESFGFISIISIDGSPDLISADNFTVEQRHLDGNPQLVRDMAKKKATLLLAGLSDVRANDPEVDTLAALQLAVRSFASAPINSKKEIILLDTGLSTSGILNFRNNLLSADPETVANLLEEKEEIPDLSGITVTWSQMGDVCEPQPVLSEKQVNRMNAIWKAIVERTGGIYNSSKTVPNPGTVSGELPEVSTVGLPPEEPVVFDSTAEMSAGFFDTPQFLSETQVQFIGDSHKYVSPDLAVTVLTPIASFMMNNPDFENILLVGTTAGDDNTEINLNLSTARADAVKMTLVSLGVSADRILTLGLGSNDPWHIYGVGTSGELAAQNRKVVLISTKTPLAAELMGQDTVR